MSVAAENFSLSVEDYQALNKEALLRAHRLAKVKGRGARSFLYSIALWCVFVFLFMLIFSLSQRFELSIFTDFDSKTFWVTSALAVVFFLVFLVQYRSEINRLHKALWNSATGESHTVSLNAEGIEEQTALGVVNRKWEGITEIVEGANHIFFFFSSNLAIIVPKRVFSGSGEVNAFLSDSREKWASKRELMGKKPTEP